MTDLDIKRELMLISLRTDLLVVKIMNHVEQDFFSWNLLSDTYNFNAEDLSWHSCICSCWSNVSTLFCCQGIIWANVDSTCLKVLAWYQCARTYLSNMGYSLLGVFGNEILQHPLEVLFMWIQNDNHKFTVSIQKTFTRHCLELKVEEEMNNDEHQVKLPLVRAVSYQLHCIISW